MPKKILYPPRGMDVIEAIDLAHILYNNGKKLKVSTYAELLDMAESGGAFRTKVNTLLKYGLIEKKNDEVFTTNLLRDIINAYDEKEKNHLIFKAIKNVPLFNELLNFYKDGQLDLEKLDKVLIRQFGVNERSAKPVKKCIEKSLSYIGALNKLTGKIDLSLEEKISVNNKDVETGEVNLESKKNFVVEPKGDLLKSISNSDILDLVIFFASYLDPMDISIEKISDIIENNRGLSHTKLVFDLLKKVIDDGSISQDKLQVLLAAVRQDLKIE